MKVYCDVCEEAQASVMCCADEAALCTECDTRVHAANKLASKHQRVTLLQPPPEEMPSCDICQEKTGFFFCLEDRALLCRSCDYSIHSTNALAGKHKRFLLSGIRVGLQAITTNDGGERRESTQRCSSSQISSPSMQASQLSSPAMVPVTQFKQLRSPKVAHAQNSPQVPVSQNTSTLIPQQLSPRYAERASMTHAAVESVSILTPSSSSSKQLQLAAPANMSQPGVVSALPSNVVSLPNDTFKQHVQFSSEWEMRPSLGSVHSQDMNVVGVCGSQRGGGGFVRRSSISEYLTETIPGWRVDELLNLADMVATPNNADCGSSKTDAWNSEDTDWQFEYYAVEDSASGQGPAEVPLFPSPPTFSGVVRPVKGFGNSSKQADTDCVLGYDDRPVVPDIGGIASPSTLSPTFPSQKRRRTERNF